MEMKVEMKVTEPKAKKRVQMAVFEFQEYLSVGAVESMVGVTNGINQISEIRGVM
mgnify:CR=1 FL=1